MLQDPFQVLGDFGEGSTGIRFHTAAVDGQEQERQWAVIPYQGPESRHIQAKVLSTGQVVRVCRYSCDELTEDNPKGKDIGLLII